MPGNSLEISRRVPIESTTSTYKQMSCCLDEVIQDHEKKLKENKAKQLNLLRKALGLQIVTPKDLSQTQNTNAKKNIANPNNITPKNPLEKKKISSINFLSQEKIITALLILTAIITIALILSLFTIGLSAIALAFVI